MRYWWLNFGDDADAQIDGGYVGLPRRDAVGATKARWTAVKDLAPGDLGFGFLDGELASVFAVAAAAERDELADGVGRAYDALVAEARHFDVEDAVEASRLAPRIAKLLPVGAAPWEKEPGRHGELHALPDAAGRELLSALGQMLPPGDAEAPLDALCAALEAGDLPDERVEALVQSRFGVGPFGEGALAQYGGRCCVSGVALPMLLKVAHLKPWLDCDDDERVDPDNGLPFAPAALVCFDSGLVSFDGEGKLLRSEELPEDDARRMGLGPETRIALGDGGRAAYLAWHREKVFLP